MGNNDEHKYIPTPEAPDGVRPGDVRDVEITEDMIAEMLRKRVVRRMNEEELKAWTRAIHVVCSESWVPALKYGYTNLMPFVDEGCDTAYTDCHFRIGLSPDLLDPEKTTEEQLAVILLHETLHNIHRHGQRFEGRGLPHIVTNYVTDLEINSIIAAGVCNIKLKEPIDPNDKHVHWDWLLGDIIEIETQEKADELNKLFNNKNHPVKVGDRVYQGLLLPGRGVFWDMEPGLTAEQYLSLIDFDEYADQSNSSGVGSSDSGNGSTGTTGNSSSTGQSTGTGNSQGGESADGNQNGSEAGNAQDGNGGGSGQGGDSASVRRSFEGGTRVYQDHADGSQTTLADHQNWVDYVDIGKNPDLWKKVDELGIHPIERGLENTIRDQIAHDVEEYKRTNRAGNAAMQAMLNYVAKGLRPPVVDWRQILRQITHKVTQQMTAGRQDYTYRKRRRRSTGPIMGMPTPTEVIYPGQMAYVPRIRFAIDTSGSMSGNEYKKALSEADGIIRESNAAIEIVCVDAEAGEVFKARTIDEITHKMTGGGGTDMTAALKQVSEEKPRERPDVLIIATDGGYSWSHFIDKLAMKGLEKTAVVVLCVYKFDEDQYYSEQSKISQLAKAMKEKKPNAHLVQAWVDFDSKQRR